MGLFHYLWSRTAASNATADSNVNWAEGMAPSAVNDSARAMMASAAAYRDDIAGAIATGGTSTAYTVTSYQVFDSLAHLNGQVIAFTPHTTCGSTVTLNVDGLGAKPLRSAPGVELVSGTLVQGTPYIALYNNSDTAFYLHSFFGNPYNIPIGGGIDYWGSTTPNSSFAFATGQAINRTTYATLFGILGTTYGAGDGSTTFNLPDKVGRVSVMRDPSATRVTTNTFTSTDLGGAAGAERITLNTSHLPAYTPSGTIVSTSTPLVSGVTPWVGSTANVANVAGGQSVPTGTVGPLSVSTVSTFTGTAQGGTSTPFTNIQPSIVSNYMIRII